MPHSPSLRRTLALPVLFALALPACDAGPSATEHVDRARAFAEQRDLNASVIELKNALQKEPENAQARLLLGKVYLEMGDGAGAEKELARAGRLGAVDAELSLALARALLLERKYQEALDQLAKVPAEPPSAAARVLQGEARLGLGQRGEARAAFHQALEADPGSAEARLGLASLAIAEGRADEAGQQVRLALEKSPDDFRALLLHGELLLAQRELEAAEAAFAKALAASGERSATARLALARAKLARGDLDGASTQVDQARKQSPQDPLANYLRGAVAYQRKDLSGAQDALRDVLRVAPDHLPSLLLLGTVDYAQGRLEQAEEHLSRYTAAVPGNVASRKLLAAVRLARREPDRALDALTPVAGQAAGDAQLLALLGTAYLRKGDAA
ncbi:MAG: PEP-CTERM system TPR-repeat protein PrsT, partial [Gammaproteobacteria bacterium]|nr:PEP-CTERM system TPR-repeat protein PrsT [Gammaproteobacteria bacterium]